MFKRHSMWYVKISIPPDVRCHFGISEIKKSLKTKSKARAKIQERIFLGRLEQVFMTLRAMVLSSEQIEKLVGEYKKEQVKAAVNFIDVIPDYDREAKEGFIEDKQELLNLINDVLVNRNGIHLGTVQIAKGLLGVPDSQDLLGVPDSQEKEVFSADVLKLIKAVARTEKEIAVTILEHLQSGDSQYEREQRAKLTQAEVLPKTEDIKVLLEQHTKDMAEMLKGKIQEPENSPKRVRKSNGSDYPYKSLESVINDFKAYYLASKEVKEGTKKDMQNECTVLLEIVGKELSIDDFNRMKTLTKVKQILLKYPFQKTKRFKGKTIHEIIATETEGYKVINTKTANLYLLRAKQIVSYAAKARLTDANNVFSCQALPELESKRLPYDDDDLACLIDAICTKPLGRSPQRAERFWIILIALLHGFRLSNIIGLHKKNICVLDNRLWCFDLTEGKSKSTIRPVAIADVLLLLGFIEWVQDLDREKLFEDSSRSFGAWFNRAEVNADGSDKSLGFEAAYVTRDENKCLHSIRKSFAVSVHEISDNYKKVSDLMGHSTRDNVTATYTGRTKLAELKRITDSTTLVYGLPLDRLEKRAIELGLLKVT